MLIRRLPNTTQRNQSGGEQENTSRGLLMSVGQQKNIGWESILNLIKRE